jgi:hypothetical protein
LLACQSFFLKKLLNDEGGLGGNSYRCVPQLNKMP